METFIKPYLWLIFLIYLGIVLVLPTYRVWKQTGVNPLTFGATDSAHDYAGRVFKVLLGLLLGTVLVYCFTDWYGWLSPIAWLERPLIAAAGIWLMGLSLVWIMVAQYHMKQSWRIGIDDEHHTPLITSGIFAYSRNPVFLGMLVGIGGLFLLLPNAVTFCLFGVSYVVMQLQVRLEEAFLEGQHGQAYQAYQH
ncbi:isoprenylcysteine carboxylmethyltransferase family protein [Nibrella saemangeumensis]|uniref:Isoprenylcysteine carboxylmethyltransferase family protein n=1 Tax=Nibrella saemangeumensis TaxID=1084526 RepID=A0ABP8NGJ1_9BACT